MPKGLFEGNQDVGTVLHNGDVFYNPASKDVQLRIMNLETKQIRVLAKIFGGQGTINVPS
ncbi:MAG: hypothetical protein NT023_07215 [Armatimonadetes bacterium]|nr:hypothetical protein [Armatimonadota bacterium]